VSGNQRVVLEVDGEEPLELTTRQKVSQEPTSSATLLNTSDYARWTNHSSPKMRHYSWCDTLRKTFRGVRSLLLVTTILAFLAAAFAFVALLQPRDQNGHTTASEK
jgi:hypothetical protein